MLTWVFAVIIGVALGMLGGGGSILTVPVFTYIVGLDPKVAIASSLPVVAIISAFGAAGHWRAGHVQLRAAILFGIFTMLGGFTGARASQWLSGTAQLVLFAVVMLLAAVAMLRRAPTPAVADASGTGEAVASSLTLARLAPLGLGVGLLTGIVGVGGGFMIVPALVHFGRVPMRMAVGTSLLVIALNAASGTLGYLGQVTLPLKLLVPFTGCALIGIAVGTMAAQRVPQGALRRYFAVLLFIVGGFILYQNGSAILGSTATATRAPLASSDIALQSEV